VGSTGLQNNICEKRRFTASMIVQRR
jgi:hypothetical protein